MGQRQVGRANAEPDFFPAKCESWAKPGTCTEELTPVTCPSNLALAGPSPDGGGNPSGDDQAKDNPSGADPPEGGTGGKDVSDPSGEGRPDTREFRLAIANLQATLTPLVTGLAGIGVLLGAAMIAIGQQAGLKIAATSATVGGVILLGHGLIQAFTPA